MYRYILTIALSFLSYFSTQAQEKPEFAPVEDHMKYKTLRLAGPRVGATYLAPGYFTDVLKEDFGLTSPFISQIGWQYEYEYFQLPSGTSGLIEAVGLIGGLDQDLFIPTANIIVGIRFSDGLEFGFGPSISPQGASFVLAGGFAIKAEDVYFPINVALIPSNKGLRLSLITGFIANKPR